MNNFKNQFNNMNSKNINPMMIGSSKTSSAIKFSIAMLLGILPLLLCSLFIIDSSMAEQFKQWGQNGATNQTIDIDYGFMWLIGLAIYIGIFPLIIFLTKITKEIKLDVIPLTSSLALVMLNMFVIPHSSAWFLMLSIPSFFIIGYIIGSVFVVFYILSNMNKQFKTMQDDPKVKEMLEQMQKMQGMNPNMPKDFGKKNEKQNDQNPFVDIPTEDEEDEK